MPQAIEAVWKIESTRLIAAIARVTHDIGIAEELAQDALVTALDQEALACPPSPSRLTSPAPSPRRTPWHLEDATAKE